MLPVETNEIVQGNAPIGGLKVRAESGWFAVRPSGTENIYKIYAESFSGIDHLHRIQEEAQAIVSAALKTGPILDRTPDSSGAVSAKPGEAKQGISAEVGNSSGFS